MKNTEEKLHSKIGASSMDRWSHCPGSVALSEGMPNHSSAYAEEGTRAHDFAANRLLSGEWDPVVEPEMKGHLEVFVSEVEKDLRENSHEKDELLIEHKFDLSSVYPGLFGTADAVIYKAATKTLIVNDLKYGAGIPVDVIDNPQLKYYALGALLSSDYPVEKVVIKITQPRCFHPDGPVRAQELTALEMLSFAADLAELASRTQIANAPLSAGEWCQFCPAAPKCPELHKTALEAANAEFSPQFSYDPARLSEVLRKIPAIEAFIKNVNSFAYNEALHGRCPPGFKLVNKRAMRKWTNEELVKERLLAMQGPGHMDDFFKKELKSVAQVEKFLSKEERAQIADLVASVSSGTTLAPEEDDRPAALTGGSEFNSLTDNTVKTEME